MNEKNYIVFIPHFAITNGTVHAPYKALILSRRRNNEYGMVEMCLHPAKTKKGKKRKEKKKRRKKKRQ